MFPLFDSRCIFVSCVVHLGLIYDCRGDIRKCADYMKRAIQTAELVAFSLLALSYIVGCVFLGPAFRVQKLKNLESLS